MNHPHVFLQAGAAIVSLVILAACVPNENVEAGGTMASNTALTVNSEAVPGPAQDEATDAAPAGAQPQPPRSVTPPPMLDPKRLLGLDPAVVMAMLGEPTWRRLDGHTQVYSFVSKACRANIYFMRANEAAPFLLNHAEFRSSSPEHEDRTGVSCLASFFQQGDIPRMLLKDAETEGASPEFD